MRGQEVFRKIINITSISGTMGNAGQINYSSGKAGVTGLTKTLAKEWGQFKINVNAVAFGFVETRLTQAKEKGETVQAGEGGPEVAIGVPEQMRNMAAMIIPLQRPAQPEEAAAPVLFLASPMSNYIHGQVINVTGGQFGGYVTRTCASTTALGRQARISRFALARRLVVPEAAVRASGPLEGRRQARRAQVELPHALGAARSGAPVQWVKVSGNHAYISGHGPLDGGDVLVRGKVGADVSPERGYEAARLTALSMCASLAGRARRPGSRDRLGEGAGPRQLRARVQRNTGSHQRVQRARDGLVGRRRPPRAVGDRSGRAAVRDVSRSRGNRGGVMTLETTAPDLFARYLDDLEVGDSFTTKGRTVTEADIVNFAALTWDTYPLHVDAEWASKTMFGERIAHGMLVLSYAAGLVPMQPGPIVAFYGMEKVRFFAPTKIGDTIRVHVELKEKEERDDNDRPRDVPPAGPQPARRDGVQVDHQGAA